MIPKTIFDNFWAIKELNPTHWSVGLIEGMNKMIDHKSHVITNNAIRERLNSPNLTIGDLITAKAYGTNIGCDSDIIDDLDKAIEKLQEN